MLVVPFRPSASSYEDFSRARFMGVDFETSMVMLGGGPFYLCPADDSIPVSHPNLELDTTKHAGEKIVRSF